MSDNIYLEIENGPLVAVIDDNGESAWLYLYDNEMDELLADAFLYNRIPPITREELEQYEEGPPPISEEYADQKAVIPDPDEEQFSCMWSDDDRSLCVYHRDDPLAMIIQGNKRGYSRHIQRNCPWGQAWNEEIYAKFFSE